MSTTTTQTAPPPSRPSDDLPAITITRDFAATPAQLFRAHTDPELFVRWVGPDGTEHDRSTTGTRAPAAAGATSTPRDGEEYAFHGSFHEVREDRIVQTFTFEGIPDGVALETMTFEDLGDGRTRLHSTSLFDSFEGRDDARPAAWRSASTRATPSSTSLLADGSRCLEPSRECVLDPWSNGSASSPCCRRPRPDPASYVHGLGLEPRAVVPGEVLMIRAGEKLILSLWSEQGFEPRWADPRGGSPYRSRWRTTSPPRPRSTRSWRWRRRSAPSDDRRAPRRGAATPATSRTRRVPLGDRDQPRRDRPPRPPPADASSRAPSITTSNSSRSAPSETVWRARRSGPRSRDRRATRRRTPRPPTRHHEVAVLTLDRAPQLKPRKPGVPSTLWARFEKRFSSPHTPAVGRRWRRLHDSHG